MENIDMEALSTDIQVHASMLKHTHIRTSFPEVTIACCFAELYEEDFYLLLIKSESWRILCFTLESLKTHSPDDFPLHLYSFSAHSS